jgi:hypothetical protein
MVSKLLALSLLLTSTSAFAVPELQIGCIWANKITAEEYKGSKVIYVWGIDPNDSANIKVNKISFDYNPAIYQMAQTAFTTNSLFCKQYVGKGDPTAQYSVEKNRRH